MMKVESIMGCITTKETEIDNSLSLQQWKKPVLTEHSQRTEDIAMPGTGIAMEGMGGGGGATAPSS